MDRIRPKNVGNTCRSIHARRIAPCSLWRRWTRRIPISSSTTEMTEMYRLAEDMASAHFLTLGCAFLPFLNSEITLVSRMYINSDPPVRAGFPADGRLKFNLSGTRHRQRVQNALFPSGDPLILLHREQHVRRT